MIIAAASSGSGKTTFSLGLMRALRQRGLRVQPFKCGPDYIDPMFHRQAAGCESVNLDTYLASEAHVTGLYARRGGEADVSVVEGVMGLYDGYDGARGSSGALAALLDVPVVLLVNAQSVAYSVAALIAGFRSFCAPVIGRPVRLAGVVFNKVASESHFRSLEMACRDAGVACFGYLTRNDALAVPSRHLGLTLSAREEMERLIQRAAEEVESHVDVNRLLAATTCERRPAETAPDAGSGNLRVCVARDEAFNFTYAENLRALAQLGDVVFFSPLRDGTLPPCDALYLPGGYPELFADQLTANAEMRHSIGAFAARGGQIFAECGGFMYLCREIDGREMCGVFPFAATMEGARLHLGYRQLGEMRGHEFHYSSLRSDDGAGDVERIGGQRTATGRAVETALYRRWNTVAGYTHWYWAEHASLLPFGKETGRVAEWTAQGQKL